MTADEFRSGEAFIVMHSPKPTVNNYCHRFAAPAPLALLQHNVQAQLSSISHQPDGQGKRLAPGLIKTFISFSPKC